MLPFAPGRFSITTDQPNVSFRLWASMRAEMSGAPPGGIVTNMRIGRLGNGCACAGLANKPPKRIAPVRKAHAARVIVIIVSSPACGS
jgi:hypothetical protein